ncbi:MAG: flagellar basal body P-ring formation chaperone FlgA [Planctomycetes bacterium]|nr:flagellar basal body P-ring formation chaperone FlgA [Planctomycetota bacterium]
MTRINFTGLTLLTLLTLLGSMTPDLQADPARIILESQVSISGRKVLLKDVARFENADTGLAGELARISLGLSPNPGYTRYIDRETIETRLITQGFTSNQVSLQGAKGVVVKVRSVSISGEELILLGREFLEGELAGLDGDFVIEEQRMPQDLLVPVGEGLSAFEVKWHNAPVSRGAVSLDLQVNVDGGLFATIPLQFKIRHFNHVLLSTREIGPGEAFDASNSVVARTEITRVQGVVACSHDDMESYRARRRIEAGNVIRVEDGFLPDLVEKDRAVNIIIKKGTLSIRSRGVARQTGVLGSTVEVQNPDSGRSFKSVVTGLNEVAVNL